MADLKVELDENALKPGETVRGRASWELQFDPNNIELHLLWYTEGKGSRDAEIVKSEPIPHVGPRGTHSVAFGLPDSPYGFSGKLISLIWSIELCVDGERAVERVTFNVAPSRLEIILKEIPNASPRKSISISRG